MDGFNLIKMTDSYKASHYLQYPPGTQGMFSYLESRGGEFDRTLFFGLQYLVKRYLSRQVTYADVSDAAEFFRKHGTPFPEAGWRRVVDAHRGWLPVRIRAVSEGAVVPTRNALMTVESLDPELFWVVTWVEALLQRLWYPITVATQSWHMRHSIRHWLRETGGADAELDFKLHDFGARGVSSHESAEVGGMAHLAAGWKGSDTVEGVDAANRYYDCDMAAFSIPASEHSTITSWGRAGEYEAFENMLSQFAKPGAIVACVSDSFNIYSAVDYWISKSERVRATGATLVIRPDSGDPAPVLLDILDQFKGAGLMQPNAKGFLVLPPHFRLIQGDGVNRRSVPEILGALAERQYGASNLAFGSGGALLQKVDRDTLKFAYKCSAVRVGGEWRDVYKDPVTDPGKSSKRGLLDLRGSADDGYQTVARPAGTPLWDSAMKTYYEEGPTPYGTGTTLDEVRRLGGYHMDRWLP